jgi:hypothetical protein
MLLLRGDFMDLHLGLGLCMLACVGKVCLRTSAISLFLVSAQHLEETRGEGTVRLSGFARAGEGWGSGRHARVNTVTP